jgi:hypothetical protein
VAEPGPGEVHRARWAGRRSLVIVDRIEPGWTPPYCTHGRATCAGGCGEWCWLGSETSKVVASGEAAPLCLQCAQRLIPPAALKAAERRNLGDHRREDGPH